MGLKMRTPVLSSLLVLAIFLLWGCNGSSEKDVNQQANQTAAAQGKIAIVVKEAGESAPKTKSQAAAAKITFIELGSVNCIPCRKMQPVMRAIEEKYRQQVKVIFYDVWKPNQKKYAYQYGIRLIPTQIFVDAQGNELMRHEGYFPEAEIDRFLQSQGLKPIN